MSTEADSYQLVRCLRTGELFETYEATHPARPGRFLVEVIATGPDRADRLESFERELATLAEAANPNILEVIGLGQLPDGRTAAIWEFPGKSLTEWLHSGGSASAEAALGLLAGIASGLQAAHDRGVVHEKVGLDTVFLADDGENGREIETGGAKLGGFGLRWFAANGPRAGSGPTREIGTDLAGLAEIAERLLAPLELLTDRPSPADGLAAQTIIARARGDAPGRPFESATQFSEALARAIRERMAASTDANPFASEPEPEVNSTRRLGRIVARVGIATLATVAAVLIVGALADRGPDKKSVDKRAPRPGAVATKPVSPPLARPVFSDRATAPATPPPSAPPAPAAPTPTTITTPAPAPPAVRPPPPPPPPPPVVTAPAAPSPPKTVTIRPPQRAQRGLVWSNRLQRLVKVDELAGETP